jgi:hypothetical protein
MSNIPSCFISYYDTGARLSFSLSGRDGDSNRLQPAGQNPYHTPVQVCIPLVWVTIHPIRRWVWIEPRGPGNGCCQVAQNKPAHGQSQVAQVMLAHGQPRPSTSCSPPRNAIHSPILTSNGVLGFTVGTSLSGRYVQGTFNLNQGPDNEAVLNWHRRDQRTLA